VSGGCVVVSVTVMLGIYLRGNNPATNRKKSEPDFGQNRLLEECTTGARKKEREKTVDE
jgi:hypothetical protein